MSRDERQDRVGSVGEEAAKLFGALSDWAGDEHIASGGADCRYCPLCRAISVVRETSPEVRAHLAAAASSLLQAAAGALATEVPDQTSGDSDGVEKIDLADDAEWEQD